MKAILIFILSLCFWFQSEADSFVSGSLNSGIVASYTPPVIPLNQWQTNDWAVLIVGQSNANGVDPVINGTDDTQGNLTWNGGVIECTNIAPPYGSPVTNFTSLVPLKEGIGFYKYESIASGFAKQLYFMTGMKVTIASYAIGGQPYSVLKKGGTNSNAYQLSMASLTNWVLLKTNSPKVFCVLVDHGEAGSGAGEPSYNWCMGLWRTNYNADIKSVTHQAEDIVMFHRQIDGPDYTDLTGNGLQLKGMEDDPSKTIIDGAYYWNTYLSGGVHFESTNYVTHGKYKAKFAYRRLILGITNTSPIRPIQIAHTNNVVTIWYTGVTNGLTLDTNSMPFNTNQCYGFYLDDNNVPSQVLVTNVFIVSTNGIVNCICDHTNLDLMYVCYGQIGVANNPPTGNWGNLRDNDPTLDYEGRTMNNWGLHFRKLTTWP